MDQKDLGMHELTDQNQDEHGVQKDEVAEDAVAAGGGHEKVGKEVGGLVELPMHRAHCSLKDSSWDLADDVEKMTEMGDQRVLQGDA